MKSNHETWFPNAPTVRLGDYIKRSTANNRDMKYGTEWIAGVTNDGKFSAPRGSTIDIDLRPYKIVHDGAFVYNPSRLNLGSIAYRKEGLCIVSHLYIVFYLNERGKEEIDPIYLFMYFRRNEFYREVTFRNFGSQRPEFDFYDMSDIRIPLPDIQVQRKYAAIYSTLIANQQSYERGLEDLKLVCDTYIDRISTDKYHAIGSYIERNGKRNKDAVFQKKDVRGFNNQGEFIMPMRLFSGNVSTFKVISKGDFVYNSRVNSTIKKLSIAFNEGDDLIVTPAYESFCIIKENELYPFYLYMLLQREAFAKKVLFNSFGSATLFFDIDALGSIEIPVPDIETQRAIASIYKTYITRRRINERLKAQIKDICPILIRGSLEDGG